MGNSAPQGARNNHGSNKGNGGNGTRKSNPRQGKLCFV